MKNRFFILTTVSVVALLLWSYFLFVPQPTAKSSSSTILKPVSGNTISLVPGTETDISVIYSENADALLWKSHDPAVVTVVGSGESAHLEAHTPGIAVLDVTDGTKHCNIIVTVTKASDASAGAWQQAPAGKDPASH